MAQDDFGTVAIIGVGLLGGSIGLALRQRRAAARVVGIGRDTQRLDQALALGAIDEYGLSLDAACQAADLIILCTPVGQIIADLPSVLESARAGAVVTDVGSVKTAIVAAASGDPRFVGSHPMAGSERTGVTAARATLFEEATWAVTPIAANPPEAVARVQNLARRLGAGVVTLTPEAHDASVAVTSHLPHALATALVRLAARQADSEPQTIRLTAGSFADATRVAASSPPLWRDIFLTNRDALLATLASFRIELEGVEAALQNGDDQAVEAFFAEGARIKRKWSEQ